MEEKVSGARIKELRQERGMSADELGRLIGKNRATVYRYEDGSIDTIPLKIVKRIAEILEVRPSYLIGLSSDPEPIKQSDSLESGKNDKNAEIKRMIKEKIDSLPEDELSVLLEAIDFLAMRSRHKKDKSTAHDSSLPPVT